MIRFFAFQSLGIFVVWGEVFFCGFFFFFQLDEAPNLTVTVLKKGLCVNRQLRCFLEGTVETSKKNSPSSALGSHACPGCCSYRQLLPAHPEVSFARAVLAEELGHMLASVCSMIQKAL